MDLHARDATQESHSLNVTSRRPIANGFAIVTRCTASSYSEFDPISNEQAGPKTNSPQSGQSRKLSPVFRAICGAGHGGGGRNGGVTGGGGAFLKTNRYERVDEIAGACWPFDARK